MSANPREIQQRKEPLRIVPQPKPAPSVTIRAEIENIRRIVNGANKRLERLCEQIAEK